MILGSPIIGYLLHRYKRRNFVQVGLIIMSVAMFGFAIAGSFNNKNTFLGLAFVTRFLQGFASCTIQTTCFSISGLLYQDPQLQASVLGLLEMSVGIGLTIAPVIGSFLYASGGFQLPFLVFGCVFLGFALVVKCILPTNIDDK